MQKSNSPAVDFGMPFFNGQQGWQSAMQAAGVWNEKVGSAFAKCQAEYLDFLQRRVKADCSFAQKLASCKSPEDVMSTYTGYWETAAKDYRSQLETSAELAQTFAKVGTPTLVGDRPAR